jgi:serine/threonine protein kinase
MAELFPQLEIIELLGHGGMGAVYKARQPALDRFVALKILGPHGASETDFASRFTREARALARLSHPSIVGVHEFGEAGGLHYFIMEYVDGANLRQLQKAGQLAPREALQIVPQICDALQYAHDEGVVHRDIKPENVLIDRKRRVKIADFGLAKILGLSPDVARLTGEGHVMGTPHYMAPEQLEHPLEGITAPTSTRSASFFTRCSPANCRWANSPRHRAKYRSMRDWMRWCSVPWKKSRSSATNTPAR